MLTPMCSVAEGVRGLVKAAARSWGRYHITVNCLAVAPTLLAPTFSGLDLAPVFLPPPAVADWEPNPSDLSRVTDFLIDPQEPPLTGATLCLDGGSWMS